MSLLVYVEVLSAVINGPYQLGTEVIHIVCVKWNPSANTYIHSSGSCSILAIGSYIWSPTGKTGIGQDKWKKEGGHL